MKAIYNELFNTLKEQPEHKRPVFVDRTKETEKILADWDKEYAALRTIPCHPGCVGKWSDGQELTEGVEYEVKDYPIRPMLLTDPKLIAFPLPVMSEDGWLTTKPNFTEECILITASKIRDKWHYNSWLIEKLDDMEGNWYWGILCPDGDEWGDLNDLEAEKYLIIPKLK